MIDQHFGMSHNLIHEEILLIFSDIPRPTNHRFGWCRISEPSTVGLDLCKPEIISSTAVMSGDFWCVKMGKVGTSKQATNGYNKLNFRKSFQHAASTEICTKLC